MTSWFIFRKKICPRLIDQRSIRVNRISPSDFQHYISTAMSTLLEHKILTFFGSNNLYLWIMLTDKMNPFFCFLTDYNILRIL